MPTKPMAEPVMKKMRMMAPRVAPMVRRIAIRLGVPAYAGSKLEYTGTVTAKSVVEGEGLVEIGFRAANDQGDHVSGTAVVGLPIAKGVA